MSCLALGVSSGQSAPMSLAQESQARDRRARPILTSILAGFGVVLLGILAFDLAGYRLLDGQRYCQYAFAPIDDFEGAGSTTIDGADTGSGCTRACRWCAA